MGCCERTRLRTHTHTKTQDNIRAFFALHYSAVKRDITLKLDAHRTPESTDLISVCGRMMRGRFIWAMEAEVEVVLRVKVAAVLLRERHCYSETLRTESGSQISEVVPAGRPAH